MKVLLISFLLIAIIAVTKLEEVHYTDALKQTMSGYDDAKYRETNPDDKEIWELPSMFDWRNVDGINYVLANFNQHAPSYCGCCWTISTLTALSSRIKIMRKNAFPEIQLSPQVILSYHYPGRTVKGNASDTYCHTPYECYGCRGGSPLTIYRYIKGEGITDLSCSNFQARDWNSKRKGDESVENNWECYEFDKDGNKIDRRALAHRFTIEDYHMFLGEKNMMNEIIQNGPIQCWIQVPQENERWHGSEIISGPFKWRNHGVEVIGWGEEHGTKYWIVKNTWGTQWGNNGFVKVLRGVNSIGIENECSAGIPKDTWSQYENRNESDTEQIDLDSIDQKKENIVEREFKGKITNNIPSKPSSADSYKLLSNINFPTNFFWGHLNGINYLSQTRNQYNPNHCESGWIMAPAASLSDRFNIQRKNQFPKVLLGDQIIINFADNHKGCEGGDTLATYSYIMENGMTDTTCNPYVGLDLTSDQWSSLYTQSTAKQICQDCWMKSNFYTHIDPYPDTGAIGSFGSECEASIDYLVYHISGYGTISGQNKMKAEIFRNGPIACQIQATSEFYNWNKNIQQDSVFVSNLEKFTEANHMVSVVGWKTIDGKEYWIGRNSWGSYWGYYGLFNIPITTDNFDGANLGIQSSCAYAIPKDVTIHKDNKIESVETF